MNSELGVQATIALLSTFGLQWLKKSKYFPWLTTKTATANRWVAMVIAFCAGIGIYATWSHGTLTVSGLDPTNIFHALVRAIEQWAFQQAAYRTVVEPPLSAPTTIHIDARDSKSPVPVDELIQRTLNNVPR